MDGGEPWRSPSPTIRTRHSQGCEAGYGNVLACSPIHVKIKEQSASPVRHIWLLPTENILLTAERVCICLALPKSSRRPNGGITNPRSRPLPFVWPELSAVRGHRGEAARAPRPELTDAWPRTHVSRAVSASEIPVRAQLPFLEPTPREPAEARW